MGLMESGPDALLGFRLQSSFVMPDTYTVISGIGWYLLCSEGGTEWLPFLLFEAIAWIQVAEQFCDARHRYSDFWHRVVLAV